MQNENPDSAFWERADAVINLANQQGKHISNDDVSASLLYAAARFNAFIAASKSHDLADLAAHKDEAVQYFTEQYRKMFIENLDDYLENYESYIADKRRA